MEIQKFNPTKAEITKAIEEVKDLTVKDGESYKTVKQAKKKIADYRIAITKFGKEQRAEALAWQREVLRQEKELLEMIEPTETRFKTELSEFDEAKKREERKVLLPSRKKMLEEIELKMTDDELLDMDENEFSTFFTEKKMEYLEEKDRIAKEKEAEKKREAEIKEAQKQAKLRERERLARVEERRKEREKQEAEEKAQKEKEEKEKLEKDKVFQQFLKDNNFNKETDILQQDENEIRLYRIVNTLKK
jgi:hypothetical protein